MLSYPYSLPVKAYPGFKTQIKSHFLQGPFLDQLPRSDIFLFQNPLELSLYYLLITHFISFL